MLQSGDFTFNRSFTQSEVLYFRLNTVDIKRVTDGLYASYSKLINYSMTVPKAEGKGSTTKPWWLGQIKRLFGLINEKIGKWLSGDNAALPRAAGRIGYAFACAILNHHRTAPAKRGSVFLLFSSILP